MTTSNQYTLDSAVGDETFNNTTSETSSVETVIPETVYASEPTILPEETVIEPVPVALQPTQQESITPEKPVEVIPAKKIIVTGKPPVNSAGKSIF